MKPGAVDLDGNKIIVEIEDDKVNRLYEEFKSRGRPKRELNRMIANLEISADAKALIKSIMDAVIKMGDVVLRIGKRIVEIVFDIIKRFPSDEPEEVIAHELIFKARLGIGEKAYKFLSLPKNLSPFINAFWAGGAASGAASSSVVAGALFAPTGFGSVLTTIGIGAGVVTPIGWVVGAAYPDGRDALLPRWCGDVELADWEGERTCR